MFTLAKITRDTRLAAKFGSIGLAIILFLFFSYKAVVFIYGVLNPPQVAPPDMKYGDLVSTLPVQTQRGSYTYSLNTITGTLPNFPSRIRVYKTVNPEPDLLTLQKIRDTIDQLENMSYDLNTEILVRPSEYRWSNAAGGSLTYNTLHKNFGFNSGANLDDPNHRFRDENSMVSATLSFIQMMGSQTSGINQSNVKIEYYRSDGRNLIPVENASNAYLARINLYQNNLTVDPFAYKAEDIVNVESLPIYYEDLERSNQSFILKAASRQPQVISGVYAHFPVDTSDYGMYPLKTSEKAYEDLQSGNAYVIANEASGSVSITDVKLGYFLPPTFSEYVIPIYVFSGTDFTAYVYAIDEYIPANANQSSTN